MRLYCQRLPLITSILLLFSLVVYSPLMGAPAKSAAPWHGTTLAKAMDNAMALPGIGYDSFGERVSYSPCMSTKTAWEGEYKVEAHIHQPLSAKQVEAMVGKLPQSYSWLNSRHSRTVLNEISSRRPLRHVQVYGIKISGLEAFAKDLALDPKIWASGDREQLLARCGDRFVRRATFGGVLLVGYYFDFATEMQKNELTRRYDLDQIGLESLFSTIATADLKKLVSHIGIMAFQWGGEPAKLYNLVAGDHIRCRIGQLKQCLALSEQVVSYVAGQGGFHDQIVAVGPEQAVNSAPLAIVTSPYSEVDGAVIDWQWPEVSWAAKAETLNILTRLTTAQRLVASQRHNALGSAQEDGLREAARMLASLRGELMLAIDRCQALPADCPSEVERLSPALRKLDPAAYNAPAFPHLLTICQNPSPFGRAASDLARIFNKFKLERQECRYNFDYLLQLNQLDLGGLGLENVAGLASLEPLKKLDLSHNAIGDGLPLLQLPNLRVLDVSHNKIKNIELLKREFSRRGVDFRFDGNPTETPRER